MKSKVLNAVAALMNFLFGVVILCYSFIAPNVTRASQNELIVMNQISLFTLAILIVVAIANLILLIANRQNSVFAFAYVISIIASAFYIFKIDIIAILYLLAALLICIQVLRENIIERNNTLFMIFLSIIIATILLFGIYALTYKDSVEDLNEKDNIGQTEYKEDFFEYVSEVNIDDLYLNVEQNGKWGYINQKGQKVIDFKYEYASPFIKIEKNNKQFEVALVCDETSGYLILKNERIVFSYKNDINVNDYEAQMDKLEEIYRNTLKQEKDFDDSYIKAKTENKRKIQAYESGGYLYPINEDYDVYIKISSQTNGVNRHELIKKTGDKNVKITIDCDNLDYDADYLYVYSNGYLPFYKNSAGIQGYYTNNMDRVELKGNAQILEFYDNNILMKDYNENLIYFMDENGNVLSDKYKDIYVYSGGYIVKKQNNKYTLIDKNFKQIIDKEFDYINPVLIDKGILICADLPQEINFNSENYADNISYKLMDLSGNVFEGEYTNIYNIMNKLDEGENINNFKEDLTDIEYHFVGDKFYNN